MVIPVAEICYKETSAHRSLRRQRVDARLVVRLTKAATLLNAHHGSDSGLPKHVLDAFQHCPLLKDVSILFAKDVAPEDDGSSNDGDSPMANVG